MGARTWFPIAEMNGGFAMPRLADYVVLSDSSFTIQTGGDIDRSFNVNLEADAHLASRAILSFMLAAQNGANSPQLMIEVNGAQQLNGTLQDGPFVTVLHELVNQNVLQVNNNTGVSWRNACAGSVRAWAVSAGTAEDDVAAGGDGVAPLAYNPRRRDL